MSFLERITGAIKGPAPVDPATFNDPVALKASWEPLEGGGSSFRTHKAMQVAANRVEFKPTVMIRIFPLIFAIIPMVVMYFAVLQNYIGVGKVKPGWELAFAIPFVSLFVGVGVYLFLHFSKTVVFDVNYGYFWKGKSNSIDPLNPIIQKDAVKLSDIHALQIISEWVVSHNRNSTSRYKSYELNLILKSAERKNVTDHGNLKALREDARMLGQFLSVPVWDATAKTDSSY